MCKLFSEKTAVYKVVGFNVRKCAKQGIPSDVFGFWDRGKGNTFLVKNIPPTVAPGDSFSLNTEFENRNLMDEFNVSHFIVARISDRTDIFNQDFKQIILNPIFKS